MAIPHNIIRTRRTLERLAVLAVLCTAPLWASATHAEGGPPQGLPVKAVSVSVGPVTDEITAVGSLRANEAVMLRPEIEGRVSAIHFTEGRMVKAGTLLLSIDPAVYQATFAASNADAQLNQSRYKRAEELFKKKLISQQALDEARANTAMSDAHRAGDQARLVKTELRAPFTGIIGLRWVSPGDYIKAGQDIARIEDIATLKLDFRLPEQYLPRLHSGQIVKARVDAYPDAFQGEVYAVETALDEQTRSALVRARVLNPETRLRPGMFARVSLALTTRSDALQVPEQAIVPKGGSSLVFRVVQGKVAVTPVTTGVRQKGMVEITKGLAATDQVITDGQIKLQDGMPVTVMGTGK